MNKITTAILLFMLGMGNFAYAFSGPSCMMASPFAQGIQAAQTMPACCQSNTGACCKIKTASRIFPQALTSAQTQNPAPSIVTFTRSDTTELKDVTVRRGSSSESPPEKEPLYSLYSVYRV